MAKDKPKDHTHLIYSGWGLLLIVLYGLIQIALIYESPTEVRIDWEDCRDGLGYPNNQPKSLCGTYQEQLDSMNRRLNEWWVTIGLFALAAIITLEVGYRRKWQSSSS